MVDQTSCEVFTYNLQTNVEEVKVTGLVRPKSVSIFKNCTHTLYVITDTDAHQVLVYNATWGLISTLGGFGAGEGQLKLPQAAFVSPNNTVFIADHNNFRVEELSMDGEFLRHVLTQGNDGIGKPVDISFVKEQFEYLWLSHTGTQNLKRFKIY